MKTVMEKVKNIRKVIILILLHIVFYIVLLGIYLRIFKDPATAFLVEFITVNILYILYYYFFKKSAEPQSSEGKN